MAEFDIFKIHDGQYIIDSLYAFGCKEKSKTIRMGRYWLPCEYEVIPVGMFYRIFNINAKPGDLSCEIINKGGELILVDRGMSHKLLRKPDITPAKENG